MLMRFDGAMAPKTVRGTMAGKPEATTPAEPLRKERRVGFIPFPLLKLRFYLCRGLESNAGGSLVPHCAAFGQEQHDPRFRCSDRGLKRLDSILYTNKQFKKLIDSRYRFRVKFVPVAY
jgi:hypothetical protein